MSTALSAANLRLKLGQWDKAAAAYRRVLQAAGGDSADAAMRGMAGMVPSEAEAGMARGKLREAEEGLRRQQAEPMSPTPTPNPTPNPNSNQVWESQITTLIVSKARSLQELSAPHEQPLLLNTVSK